MRLEVIRGCFLNSFSRVACLAHNSCSLSLIKISSLLICAFRSFNSSFLLCIKNSAVHQDSCILFGGSFPVAMGVPCAGGGMLTCGTERTCCEGALGEGVFGCAGAASCIVAFAGGSQSFFRFACPWGADILVTSVVSGDDSCAPGFSETIVLGKY